VDRTTETRIASPKAPSQAIRVRKIKRSGPSKIISKSSLKKIQALGA
jgi:hypothetical protein